MAGELGKASLDLEAELSRFEANINRAGRTAEGLDRQLGALAAIADVADKALNEVGLSPGKAAESRASAEAILEGVHGISDEARDAARELDDVKLTETQGVESEAAGGMIDRILNSISRNADQAKRKLLEVRLAAGRSGFGAVIGRVGVLGAAIGRVGVLGAAIGVGALAGPAAGPAALGLLAAIPTLALLAVGALGTLALAFGGVGKAIGGDAKAFKDLGPAAQQFVLTVRSLDGWFDKLKQTASASLFPGLTKGLKAALSPGTVSAISKAVAELGHALGAAGAQWGRYFGSREFQSIFGPLMQSAARNIGVLSDTLLHLFDALGVIARAAIPFTNWLATVADKGAKFADSWVHAKDASGALAHGMDEARKSLTLVAKLFGPVISVVVALGKALYPLAKVALKDLTDGLDALASVVGKGAPAIRDALGGALAVLVSAVKVAGPAVATLAGVLLELIGTLGRALVPIIRDLAPVFKALQQVFSELEPPLAKIIRDVVGGLEPAVKALAKPTADLIRALGPLLAGALKLLDPLLKLTADLIARVATAFGLVIEGAAKALTWVEKHWRGLGGFFKNLGHAIVGAFEYVWYLLEKGALIAALAIVEPFSHLPSFLGGWARKAKDSMQGQLDKLHAPNMAWGGYAEKAGRYTGEMWRRGFLGAIAGLVQDAFKGIGAAVRAYANSKHHHHHHHKPRKPETDPATAGPFGAPPPFTTNTGSGSAGGGQSVIPQSALNLEALARRQDQQAAALGYSGKKARQHLEKEVTDLQKADRILEEKLKHAHGKRRTELYNAITANMKKIDEARKRMRDAAGKARQAHLNLVLDQAKLAVENAQVGSKAYDKAVAAEEKALRAEIRYWDKRAHNMKLSADARDKALRKEIEYEKQLKALKKALAAATAAANTANIAQFLQSFTDIQNTFASNAVPIDSGGGKKTDTHLYDIKNEARESNRHLRAMRDKGRFPGSQMGQDSAMAATT